MRTKRRPQSGVGAGVSSRPVSGGPVAPAAARQRRVTSLLQQVIAVFTRQYMYSRLPNAAAPCVCGCRIIWPPSVQVIVHVAWSMLLLVLVQWTLTTWMPCGASQSRPRPCTTPNPPPLPAASRATRARVQQRRTMVAATASPSWAGQPPRCRSGGLGRPSAASPTLKTALRSAPPRAPVQVNLQP